MNPPHLPHPLFSSLSLAFALTLSCATFSVGCAAPLEGDEEFVETVMPGVGASGVENCDFLDCTAPGPSTVSPAVQPSGVTPPATTTEPSVDPTTSGPTDTSVSPPAPILSDACADVPTRVFAVKCGGSGCHGAGAPYVDLVSDVDNLPERLRNGTATSSRCNSRPLVDSSSVDNSVMIDVLGDDYCTIAAMPIGPGLEGNEEACIIEWVRAVAAGEI